MGKRLAGKRTCGKKTGGEKTGGEKNGGEKTGHPYNGLVRQMKWITWFLSLVPEALDYKVLPL